MRYTKKHIMEALRYWKKELKTLNEDANSNRVTVQELYDALGEAIANGDGGENVWIRIDTETGMFESMMHRSPRDYSVVEGGRMGKVLNACAICDRNIDKGLVMPA